MPRYYISGSGREKERARERKRREEGGGRETGDIAPGAYTHTHFFPLATVDIYTPTQRHVSHVSFRDFLCITSSARVRAPKGKQASGKGDSEEKRGERECVCVCVANPATNTVWNVCFPNGHNKLIYVRRYIKTRRLSLFLASRDRPRFHDFFDSAVSFSARSPSVRSSVYPTVPDRSREHSTWSARRSVTKVIVIAGEETSRQRSVLLSRRDFLPRVVVVNDLSSRRS